MLPPSDGDHDGIWDFKQRILALAVAACLSPVGESTGSALMRGAGCPRGSARGKRARGGGEPKGSWLLACDRWWVSSSPQLLEASTAQFTHVLSMNSQCLYRYLLCAPPRQHDCGGFLDGAASTGLDGSRERAIHRLRRAAKHDCLPGALGAVHQGACKQELHTASAHLESRGQCHDVSGGRRHSPRRGRHPESRVRREHCRQVRKPSLNAAPSRTTA
jgi:hypothetical protein